MSDDIVIKVDNVSKTFRLPHEKNTSIKSAVLNFYRRKRTFEKQQALKDISFEVKKGEFFGIVGRNGSGKSTLLKLLAGIYSPSKGSIAINGKLTPFIELGVGFNPELTGRENVFLNGALLGFSRKEMSAMYDDIVDFAEIKRFMDQKLKNYSSGMQVRLAFSIAIRAKSDVLLIDEVLAVGDSIFQKKCYDYFRQLKQDKKTVIFVSHDSDALLKYCDRGLLIEQGAMVTKDKIERVVNEYIDVLNADEDQKKEATEKVKTRWGTGAARVIATTTLDAKGQAKANFVDNDDTIIINVEYKAKKGISEPVYGIIISDEDEHRVFTSNTMINNVKTRDLKEGEAITLQWRIPNVLNSGTFSVAPAIANNDGSTIFDWVESSCKFRVRKKVKSAAFINAKHDIIVI